MMGSVIKKGDKVKFITLWEKELPGVHEVIDVSRYLVRLKELEQYGWFDGDNVELVEKGKEKIR